MSTVQSPEQQEQEMRAKRDRLWARCRTGTRWDLTRFERAEREYRWFCEDHNLPYVDF